MYHAFEKNYVSSGICSRHQQYFVSGPRTNEAADWLYGSLVLCRWFWPQVCLMLLLKSHQSYMKLYTVITNTFSSFV